MIKSITKMGDIALILHEDTNNYRLEYTRNTANIENICKLKNIISTLRNYNYYYRECLTDVNVGSEILQKKSQINSVAASIILTASVLSSSAYARGRDGVLPLLIILIHYSTNLIVGYREAKENSKNYQLIAENLRSAIQIIDDCINILQEEINMLKHNDIAKYEIDEKTIELEQPMPDSIEYISRVIHSYEEGSSIDVNRLFSDLDTLDENLEYQKIKRFWN